jgi:RNA polymerase sigma-70 factor (ECF subfamily)
MDGVRARDTRALEELYHNYHPRLTRFLMRLIHRPQMVEEVFDDTMMAVWNKPESFRGACSVSTWIFAIAYRKALKSLRRRDEPIEGNETDNQIFEDAGPDEQLKRERVQLLLMDAISRLSVDHRTVIDLAYFHDKSYQEICEIMACPLNTVKTRMFHARRELRQKLAGDLVEWL